ncbi:MAG TPA: glycoside hydrolase family 2 TIM barrel-domain containing protein [Candidatus Sulfotelmatobacter sp.]|nr:glycoside hydrolase family 2 TIM barrel-domain containing protein [Candidatus Sulfotelmatobacter sp.]
MQGTGQNSSRAVINLNGEWQRYVNDKPTGTVRVPSSLRPGGMYTLRRDFVLPRLEKQRAMVRFDAITYYGRVSVNGKELGTTLPYVPQEFDCTAQAKEGRNTVEVLIVDAGTGPNGLGKTEVAYGTTGGWETYGGIIRDASVEIRPTSFVDNVRFGYRLSDGYGKAACTAQVFVSSSEGGSGECELVLMLGESEVARGKAPVQMTAGATTTVEVTFDVNDVVMWSPSEPNLYELHATLKGPGGEDRWSCRTGFRDVKIQGHEFFLNGERLVLMGTCRHDMWEEQGFTLSPAQQDKDMRMIKAQGGNFIRLVHYPHDRRIVDLAQELGILITEEPGWWQVDFSKLDRASLDLGMRILETTIRRDWNSPAVFGWLLGNESEFTVEYLKEAKALCNRLDPIFRPVSVAHINGDIPHAKKMFDDSGLDFYDWHAYEFSEDKFYTFPEQFGPAKPLTFTEWGWEDAGHGDLFHERDFDSLLLQTERGKVAGHSFWSWNDMRQYSRRDWATDDGVLRSGAVKEDRSLREPIYSRLATLFAGRREIRPYTAPDLPQVLPLAWSPFAPGTSRDVVDLQPVADSQTKAWTAMEAALKDYWPKTRMGQEQWERTGSHFRLWQSPELEIGGVSFHAPVVDGCVRPIVLTSDAPEVTIPIGRRCSKLHFLGQVTLPEGYPLHGRAGDAVATYSIVGEKGTQDIPIRNGIEVAQANRIYEATRIDPIAKDAQPALLYKKDIVREQYQFLLWSMPVKPGRVQSLRCKLNAGQPGLAILAITTES